MQWLCEKQVPCYHTIADFRTYKSDDKAEEKINHRNALKEVFRAFNRFLNGEELFGKETVATDGTKRQEQDPEITQISQTDPDARSIVINNSGHAEVAYNIVTAVDDKYKLIANYLTENIKDTTLLADSLIAVKAEFDTNFDTNFDENLHKSAENTEGAIAIDLTRKLNKNTTLNGLADKGFHAATQLQECADNNIITYVAVPQPAYSGKDKDFTINNFIYNENDDNFTCPNNKTLTTNGKLYDKKNRRGVFILKFKRYNMSPTECAACPFANKCLSKTAIKYRISRQLERTENQNTVNDNKLRLESIKGKLLYRKRQAIVEHPFGIIKRQWATDHTLLRGLDKVNAEFAIVFTCYNLRRAVSILTAKTLIDKLKALKNTAKASFYRWFHHSLRQTNHIMQTFTIFANLQPKLIIYAAC